MRATGTEVLRLYSELARLRLHPHRPAGEQHSDKAVNSAGNRPDGAATQSLAGDEPVGAEFLRLLAYTVILIFLIAVPRRALSQVDYNGVVSTLAA